MRRITAFTIAILLAFGVTVSATTVPTDKTTAGAAPSGNLITRNTTTATLAATTTVATTTTTAATTTTATTTANTTVATGKTTAGAAPSGNLITQSTTAATLAATTTVATTITTATTTTTTTTTVPTTTTTTAKPTDPHIENVQYAVEELPEGAVFHGEKMKWTDGRNGGKALQFDGIADCIEIDIHEQTGPFTLSMWVNWQANIHNPNAIGQRLFSLGLKNTENQLTFIPWHSAYAEDGQLNNGMSLQVACYQEKWIRQEAFHPTDSAISNMLTPNIWHHIAVTVGEKSVSLFIDGMLWNTLDLAFTYADLKANTLFIGGATQELYLFEGAMEDIRLYENALSQQQVMRLFRDADAFDATLTETPHVYTPAPLPQNVVMSQSQCIVSTIGDNGIVNTVEVTPGTAFWEVPTLSGGQSVTCSLYLENKSKHVSGISLDNIALPDPTSPAYKYLSDIQITVSDLNGVLYVGRYTDLTADKLPIRLEKLPYNGSRCYTITLSRELSSTAEFVSVSVPWSFTTTVYPTAQNAVSEHRPLVWLIVLLLGSIVAVGFSFYCAIVQKRRRIFTVWDSLAGACRNKIKRATDDTEQTKTDDKQDI